MPARDTGGRRGRSGGVNHPGGHRDVRTGIVGARPVTARGGDPEPTITERDPGLAHGTHPGWWRLAQWGMTARINREPVMAAYTAATAAAKSRRPLAAVHAGHLVAELDRVASAWYGERDGNMILLDQLADRPRRRRVRPSIADAYPDDGSAPARPHRRRR